MEPITKDAGKVKGYEVIYFEEALIEKVRGNETSFASSGPLSLIFVKEYARFFFQLNDWRYPLMRRLHISSSTEKQGEGRLYILPALGGSAYSLRILKGSSQAFDNLDTILGMNSKFSVIGKEMPTRKLEASPDDKLVRRMKETGPKEIIEGTVKQVIHKVQNKAATLKTGTKNLTSTKKRINLKEIKNKNFRKEAKSTIKKDFFTSQAKISKEFAQRRKDNINLSQIKEFDDLKKLGDLATFYISKDELEQSILNCKDLINQMSGKKEEEGQEKKGLMESLKEGVQNVRQAVTGIVGGRTQERAGDRNVATQQAQGQTEVAGGMSHYQG